MCIAIYKPQGKTISKETLKRCYDINPDGAGFMFAEDKELHIKKGFFNFNKFYEAYKPHQDKKCVIHFRIKTHGKIDETNCHPFKINKSLAFVHNGIISGFGDDIFSDTIGFNEQVLKKLVNKWGNLALFQDPVVDLIESRIGYSKLIMLDRHNNHKIFNEKKGEWSDGVWYSNTGYKPAPVFKTNQISFNYWKPREPARLTQVPLAQTFAEGDLCEVINPIYDLVTDTTVDVGEWVEIVKVNKDATVDIMVDEPGPGEPAFYYCVPTNKLENYDYGDDYASLPATL